MRKIILGLLLTFTSITCLQLQAGAQQNDTIDPQKKAAIMELLDVTGTRQNLQLMADAMRENFKAQVPEMTESIIEEFDKALNYDSLVSIIIPIYAKHWSTEEMKGMVAFYKSPLGQRMMKEMPAILKESMAANMQRSKQIGARIQEKIQEMKEAAQDSQPSKNEVEEKPPLGDDI